MKRIKKFFLTVTIIAFAFSGSVNVSATQIEMGEEVLEEPDVIFSITEDYPEIMARSGVLIDADSGIVIFGKNMDEKLYPASITKIMTTLLALEYAGDDFDQRIYFSNYAVYSIPYGASHIAMDEGETLSLEDALYAIMLASANEVSNAVAEHIAGSVEEFGVMMTNRAKALGCKNTNFTNPHGLHDDDHYTTAYDMSLIMAEAIKHPKFIEIMTTANTSIPPTEKQTEPKPLNNSHKMMHRGSIYYNENVIGGKTGYTDEAGQTLVTLAEKDGNKLIAVDMKNSNYQTYTDTSAMIEYGFKQFNTVMVLDKNSIDAEVSVFDSMAEGAELVGTVGVKAEESIIKSLPIDGEKLEKNINLPDKIAGQVNKGDKLGTVEISYLGNTIWETQLIAQSSIEMPEPEAETVFAKSKTDGIISNNNESIFGSISIYVKIAGLVIGVTLITRLIVVIYRKAVSKKRRRMYYRSNLSKRYRYK